VLILVEEERTVAVAFTKVETSQEAAYVDHLAQPLGPAAHEVPPGVTLPAIGSTLLVSHSIGTIV
jgi:hypothetical protein